MSGMTTDQFRDVMKQYQATWPKTKLNEKTEEAWYPVMSEFSPIHAYQALHRLAADQDLMPMLSQFRRMAAAVRDELQDDETPVKVDPTHDPKNYPESAYLKAAKVLILGKAGRYLLMSPVVDLDIEGAGLKSKILECAARHKEHLDSGRKPDANMLVEVSNLGSAVEEWWKPRAEQITEAMRAHGEAIDMRHQQRRPETAATTRRKR
jgi:hypothetical protein